MYTTPRYGILKIIESEMFIYVILFLIAITAILFFRAKRKRSLERNLLRSSIHEIDKMDGFLFERYLKQLFENQGYKVLKTNDRSDFGADLIMTKEKKKIVVQAKRYTKGVGIDAVQEVVGALAYYKATEAWVVTNSTFTKSAVDLAKVTSVHLFDRKRLMTMLKEMDLSGDTLHNVKKVNGFRKSKTEVAKGHECKKCNAQMVVRHSKLYGSFYGCSNYPKCKFTKPIKKRGVAL